MKYELKPFQREGRDFLAERTRAVLGDQMRLGKTVQAIAACDKRDLQRILIICPAVARAVWVEHFKLWSERSWIFCADPKSHMNVAADRIVSVISYDQARMYPEKLKERRWDVLICDESHYLKNLTAQRTRAVFAKNGISWYTDRIWCLSGTPAPNHYGELWPILKVFGLTKLSYYDFIYYFCKLDMDGNIVGNRTDRTPTLRALLRPVFLRRLKKQVAPELPDCEIESYPVQSSTDFLDLIRPVEWAEMQATAYSQEKALKSALSALPPDEHAAYLAEVADNYVTMRRINALLKTPAVFDIVKFEIENNLVDKMVVFCYHRDCIKVLAQLLRGKKIKTEVIYGGTPDKKREAALRAFNRPTARGGARVFICQILAAGIAIDLSAAHEGIALEEDWVPGNNAQAFERMGGFKQTEPISIRKVYIPGSIDEQIAETLTRKERELSALFD